MIHPAWWFLLGAFVITTLKRDRSKALADNLKETGEALTAVFGILLLAAMALAITAAATLLIVNLITGWLPGDGNRPSDQQSWFFGLLATTMLLEVTHGWAPRTRRQRRDRRAGNT